MFVETALKTVHNEAIFNLNNGVNRHNGRYWSSQNSHWFQEAQIQNPQKVHVWEGVVEGRIVGPFFIDENLNFEKHLDLLRNLIIPSCRLLFASEIMLLTNNYGSNTMGYHHILRQISGTT
ncbi:hypothetical protein NQ318_001325 [Aromia moschata]|uniref:Uncharacterized protein n=1 Tax=Aromia moschata TaxID=1265417 RepID=A0AAV8ZEJ5_9CUCU|nr:hypothetical protein NQ318_001325 [Aromia moschata]